MRNTPQTTTNLTVPPTWGYDIDQALLDDLMAISDEELKMMQEEYDRQQNEKINNEENEIEMDEQAEMESDIETEVENNGWWSYIWDIRYNKYKSIIIIDWKTIDFNKETWDKDFIEATIIINNKDTLKNISSALNDMGQDGHAMVIDIIAQSNMGQDGHAMEFEELEL